MSSGDICWGFLGLLGYVAKYDTALVTEAQVRGFFGNSAVVTLALAEFGMLKRVEGGFEPLGADRIVAAKQAKRLGGQKSLKNLKQNTPKKRIQPVEVHRAPPAEHRLDTGRAPATPPADVQQNTGSLPNTYNLIPKLETKALSTKVDLACDVFDYWKFVFKKTQAVFSKERRKAVQARLDDGYAVEKLKDAVLGCSKTAHNMGQNERGEKYIDLELICRTAAQVDRFIENATHPPRPSQKNGAAWTQGENVWNENTDFVAGLTGGVP